MTKRKTPLQHQALDYLYSEDRYPSHNAMDVYALSLNLTYKQVRGWFVEKRRRDKNKTTSSTTKCIPHTTTTTSNHQDRITTGRGKGYIMNNKSILRGDNDKSKLLNQRPLLNRHMLSLDTILKHIRKDAPPVGVNFDPLPPGAAFHLNTTTGPTYDSTCARKKSVIKKRKVSISPISYFEANTKKRVPVMKHGMGKGLMIDRENANVRFELTPAKSTKPLRPRKKSHHKLATKQSRVGTKLLERRRRAISSTKSGDKAENTKKPHHAECKLAQEGVRSQEDSNAIAKLMDDEELELRELKAGLNPPTCSAHLAFNGMHNCSLCKDLLARFPPHSVKMKQPFCMQPWGSSLELVKKLFKVFRFLYNHSNTFDICFFTLDEFAQAFHDKDSLLLGKIHMALLKVLFSDVEMELTGGYLPHASRDYRFIGFLDLVRRQDFILKSWNESLNPITWIEIMRQVLIAAGFNSKPNKYSRESVNKHDNHLAEYGLRPETLKGELFSILSEQGSNGLKVSELAKAFQVVELHLTNTTEELELLICSTLSSDITLFEKISTSAYRLRGNPQTGKGAGYYPSDSDDSGSVDGAFEDSSANSGDESELNSQPEPVSV